jgi:hypothetical protein
LTGVVFGLWIAPRNLYFATAMAARTLFAIAQLSQALALGALHDLGD